VHLFFLILLIFLIPLLLPTVDSTVLITPEKEVISAMNEAIVLTMKIDEIPRDNMIIVQILDSTGYMFQGGQPVPVDNNGIAKIDFRGIHEPIVGGIYTVVITGVDENNEIIKDTGQFSIGLKDKRDYAEKNVSNIQESEEGGGCLIATAAYGSEMSPQVQQLRELRDNTLLKTESGTAFMNTFNNIYYSFSPTIADMERENNSFKEFVKYLIAPMLYTLSLLALDHTISEIEMIFYGVLIIVLNIIIYFALPSILFITLKRILIKKLL
jgi:hypothetical protein